MNCSLKDCLQWHHSINSLLAFFFFRSVVQLYSLCSVVVAPQIIWKCYVCIVWTVNGWLWGLSHSACALSVFSGVNTLLSLVFIPTFSSIPICFSNSWKQKFVIELKCWWCQSDWLWWVCLIPLKWTCLLLLIYSISNISTQQWHHYSHWFTHLVSRGSWKKIQRQSLKRGKEAVLLHTV